MSTNLQLIKKIPFIGKAWEWQPSDTQKSFEAFNHYLSLGPSRTLGKVAELVGKSEPLINRWSSEHRWVERSTLYDADLIRIRKAEEKKIHIEKIRSFLNNEEVISNKYFFLSDKIASIYIAKLEDKINEATFTMEQMGKYLKLSKELVLAGQILKLEALGINKMLKKHEMEKEAKKDHKDNVVANDDDFEEDNEEQDFEDDEDDTEDEFNEEEE